jgi:hypothetical protein
MPADPALVATLRAALADSKDVKFALLFGSGRATGSIRDSDLDVAYLGKDVDPLAFGSHLGLVARLEVQAVGIADPSYPLMKATPTDSPAVCSTCVYPSSSRGWQTLGFGVGGLWRGCRGLQRSSIAAEIFLSMYFHLMKVDRHKFVVQPY